MRKTVFFVSFISVSILVGFIAWSLYPQQSQQVLPSTLIAFASDEGRARHKHAEGLADYEPLLKSFQAQVLVSYCGVATAVSVLNALGLKVSQRDFFNDEARQVRSQLEVMFAGMSIAEFAGLLDAHGLKTTVFHVDNATSLVKFRAAVEKNLANEGDYLVVNYQRALLGQRKSGHISPLSAYDRETDSVLIMDTAAHKYPFTWVPIELLYAGMNTIDISSGRMRGYVEVTN
jgi:hypothetical protein